MSRAPLALALALALATTVSAARTSQAGFTYTDPSQIIQPAGFFTTQNGSGTFGSNVNEELTTFGSDAGNPTNYGPIMVSEMLTITDGGLTGSFLITFTFSAIGANFLTPGQDSFTNIMSSPSSIVVNNDTYTLSSISAGPGSSQNALFATITEVAPPTVPEPSSFILCGIAGMTGLGMAWKRRRRTG